MSLIYMELTAWKNIFCESLLLTSHNKLFILLEIEFVGRIDQSILSALH